MNNIIHRLILLALSCVLVNCGGSSAPTEPTQSHAPEAGMAGDGRLDLILDYIREKHALPALATIMVHDGLIIEKSARGNRSASANIAVTENDRWHLGSISKSMTALVTAVMVKRGIISWHTTLADVYPELIGNMQPQYEAVQLNELLSHTSGLPTEISRIPGSGSYLTDQRALNVQRYEFVTRVLALSSSTTRGRFDYSNIGYIVAGAMLERVTGSSWETLMQTYLFDPLPMTMSGFGAPDTYGIVAQPVGHAWEANNWSPIDPTNEPADNPPAFGPAGSVHASLDDMGAYLGLHLQGIRGNSVAGFLDSQEFAMLYTPFPNSTYALGWDIADQFVGHSGSNTFWHARVVLYPQKNTAFFVVTNAADIQNDMHSKSKQAIADVLDVLNARADAAFQ